jgi:hypothetical protein
MKNIFKSLSLLSAFMITLTHSEVVSAQWAQVGTTGTAGISVGFAYANSIAFEANKKLYVAYQDGAYDQKVTVKKLVSGTWTTLGTAGFAGGQGGQSCSMVISSTGVPYVAVIGPPDLKASVWKLEAGSWVKVGGVDVSDEMAFNIEIAMGSDDIPYVFFGDKKAYNGIEGRGTVKKFDGSAWQFVGAAGFTEDFIQSLDIAVDNANAPYVVFEDGAHSLKATAMKFNGTSWVQLGTVVGFTANAAKDLHISLDSDNTPYISYNRTYSSCLKFSSNVWTAVGASETGTGLSGNPSSFTALAIDQNNVPYVAFKSESTPFSITIKRYNKTNSTWEIVGQSNFTGNTAGLISITFDSFANPYVAFQDANKNYREAVFANIINDPLPVKLISFEGKFLQSEKTIALKWSTTEETGNDRFDVEAGISVTNFKKVGEVKGNDNSSVQHNYQFIDSHPIGNRLYYRLTQVDQDGTFSFSPIIFVQRDEINDFYVVNDAVSGNLLNVHIDRQPVGDTKISIYNTTGRELEKIRVKDLKDFQISTKNLLPGIYILQYADDSGIQSRKFVKY